MKPLFMALLAIVITASACKKERANVDTRVKPVQVRLKEMMFDDQGYKTQYLFRYDSAGYLAEYSLNTFIPWQSGWVKKTRIIYERDAQHRIIREISLSDNGRTGEGVYSYNINRELQRIDYYQQPDEGVPGSSFAYKWAGGKIVSMNAYAHSGQLTSKQSFAYNDKGNIAIHNGSIYPGNLQEVVKSKNTRYDDHPNYVHTVKGLDNYWYIFGMGAQALSQNNIIYNEREEQGKTVTDRWNLTYNKYGYVEKEVRTNGNQTREFIYEEIK